MLAEVSARTSAAAGGGRDGILPAGASRGLACASRQGRIRCGRAWSSAKHVGLDRYTGFFRGWTPESARRIHASDIQKLIRAMELRLLHSAPRPAPESAAPLAGLSHVDPRAGSGPRTTGGAFRTCARVKCSSEDCWKKYAVCWPKVYPAMRSLSKRWATNRHCRFFAAHALRNRPSSPPPSRRANMPSVSEPGSAAIRDIQWIIGFGDEIGSQRRQFDIIKDLARESP